MCLVSCMHPACVFSVWEAIASVLDNVVTSLWSFCLSPVFNFHRHLCCTNLGDFVRRVLLILPHELFAGIFRFFPDMFRQLFYPSAEVCREFWEAVKGCEQYRSHPVTRRPNHKTRCIPLKLHGDGVPITGPTLLASRACTSPIVQACVS